MLTLENVSKRYRAGNYGVRDVSLELTGGVLGLLGPNVLSELGLGKLVILSTHIVSDVESIATQIAIMRDGAVVALAAPEELLARTGCTRLEAAYLRLMS